MDPVPAIIQVDHPGAGELKRDLPDSFEVQFNPGEYTLEKSVQLAEIAIPGLDSPLLQFVRGQNERLTLDLFFDTTRDGMGPDATPVTDLTDPFYLLVKQQPASHAPPRISFIWGEGLQFRAVVESVRRQFTLFNPDGVPLRATLTVTFREYKTLEEQLSELKPESSDTTRRRNVQRGDTLTRIAAQEYGDPSRWRLIADANPEATEDVRRLRPGDVLEIPPVTPEAGGFAAVPPRGSP
jgi:hypothetical protein